jgi:hypothetical protein
MEIRPTVRRFPGAAFVLILGLVAALAVAMTLSIGGWGLSIGSPASGGAAQPAAQGQRQPTIQLQQPPDAQDRNQQYGQQPVTTPAPCSGSPSECAS